MGPRGVSLLLWAWYPCTCSNGAWRWASTGEAATGPVELERVELVLRYSRRVPWYQMDILSNGYGLDGLVKKRCTHPSITCANSRHFNRIPMPAAFQAFSLPLVSFVQRLEGPSVGSMVDVCGEEGPHGRMLRRNWMEGS